MHPCHQTLLTILNYITVMTKPIILTYDGQAFDLSDPHNYTFNIDTIAHALSNLCRFTGHTVEFYSVAQHSVIVSRLVPHEYALAALLHDAAEAFLGDVATPLKRLLPDYELIEIDVQAAILNAFGVPSQMLPVIKAADTKALATEVYYLMPHNISAFEEIREITPLPQPITPLQPVAAKNLFLERYQEIISGNPATLP